ncbi:sce7725 family protein [Parvicella tangerina]|uniref:Sce7725 family protein n=1 Tax=Parvicella tangerina TaxID=2829795 RepID=A0A916JPN4_9FLAO|nr:sce7725 family protein [Parvicella tangerina]CAG5086032.1 hypothetical protein CRYO30217_02983 [Parvicella tangerina]
MYFPFLRGKQFELIALRELKDLMSEKSDKVSPIIEPVKLSSTLKSTIKTLSESNINYNVIVNPSVGRFGKKVSEIISLSEEASGGYTNKQYALIIEDSTDYKAIIDTLAETVGGDLNVSLVHYSVRQDIQSILSYTSAKSNVVNNIIHTGQASTRYRREFTQDTLVSLDDFFQMQSKNADYLPVIDSRFSEEHLYFQEEGFKGFSDYLTVGEPYSESGFLPWAVAIHISYKDIDDKIRVKHFVSDSNGDNDDVAGKYLEALDKLIEWYDQTDIDSIGLQEFKSLHERQHFPGLGVLKKLSVMHHIELVLNAI